MHFYCQFDSLEQNLSDGDESTLRERMVQSFAI